MHKDGTGADLDTLAADCARWRSELAPVCRPPAAVTTAGAASALLGHASGGTADVLRALVAAHGRLVQVRERHDQLLARMRTLGPAAALTPHIDAINAAARAVSDLVSSDAATSNLARLSAELRRPGPCIAIDGDLIHDFKSALQQIVRSIESWTPNQEPAADVLNAQLAGSYARREAAMRQLTEAQKDLTQFIQLVEATVPQHAAVQRMAQFAQPTPRKRPSTFKDSPPKRAYMGSPIAPESSAYLSAESELL